MTYQPTDQRICDMGIGNSSSKKDITSFIMSCVQATARFHYIFNAVQFKPFKHFGCQVASAIFEDSLQRNCGESRICEKGYWWEGVREVEHRWVDQERSPQFRNRVPCSGNIRAARGRNSGLTRFLIVIGKPEKRQTEKVEKIIAQVCPQV